MMSVDIMMSLIFWCRHHDECRHYDENRHHDESEHNDGRVEPYLSTKVSHTLLTISHLASFAQVTNFHSKNSGVLFLYLQA
jgi:hypothetical protein